MSSYSQRDLAVFAWILGIKPKKYFSSEHESVYTVPPNEKLVDAAAADIPIILNDLPHQLVEGSRRQDRFWPADYERAGIRDPNAIPISSAQLIEMLRQRGHFSLSLPVSEWAILRLIERGLLDAQVVRIYVPNENQEGIQSENTAGPTERLWEVIARIAAQASRDPPPDDTLAGFERASDDVLISPEREPRYRLKKWEGVSTTPPNTSSYEKLCFLVVGATKALWDWWKHHADVELSPPEVEPAKADHVENPDKSAFVPASTLWGGKFPTYKKFRAFLDKTPTIRRESPQKNRLNVHAGDWTRYWAAQNQRKFEALDVESMKDELADHEAQRAEIRETKSKKQRK